MILIEQEPALPAHVEGSKAQVLLCLQTMHQQQEYSSLGDLTRFLDHLIGELAALDMPKGLTRVVLFWRNPKAVAIVQARMLPGQTFQAFQAPACWLQMAQSLPELRAWAAKMEPRVTVTAGGR